MFALKVKMAPDQVPVFSPAGLVADPLRYAATVVNNGFSIDDEAKPSLRSADADVHVLIVKKDIRVEPVEFL